MQEDGKAMAMVACFEYRKTDIGPYNEVCLGVSALAPGDRIPALYVTDLPVTTTVAHRAGREIWGYNKFVSPIDVQGDHKAFATALRDPDDALILTLEGARAASIPTPPMDVPTFSMLGGRAIRTIIRTMTPFQISSGDGLRPRRSGNQNTPWRTICGSSPSTKRVRRCCSMPIRFSSCCFRAGCCSSVALRLFEQRPRSLRSSCRGSDGRRLFLRHSSPQRFEQALCFLQVDRLEPFGKPLVDRREEIAAHIRPALIALEPRQAHRRAQLPGLGPLCARHGERAFETRFCFRRVRLGAAQCDFAGNAMDLRFVQVSLVVSGADIASPMEREASSKWPRSA